jgi:LuxR family maltose regulon positive regulatory protein
LEAANFLISSHADQGAVYRYHALLRDFLLARLAQLQPKELRSLQRRTAHWAWQHGDPETAFRHAIAGEDWDLADELTAEAWNVVVFGVAARDRDAVSETPEAQLNGRPGLAFRVAAAHLFLGNRREAERIYQIGERDLQSATPYRRDALAVISATFVLTIARLQGDYAQVRELARELEAQPIVGTFATAVRERARRSIVLSNLGTVDVATGATADAEPRLYEAMSLAREAGLDHVVLNSLSQLAMLESTRGRLRHAVELAREGVDFAERRNWETIHQGIGSRLVLGWAHYQWNELELASEQIAKAAAAARLWGDRTGTVGAALLDALVLAAAGPDGSVDGLRRLRGVRAQIQGWRPPVFLAALVQTAEARVLAASGDLEGARLAIERKELDEGDGGLVLARISLAQGAPTDALAEIEAYDPSSGARDLAGQVEAGVLEAVAKQELNDRAGAAVAIESALGLAERGSYRRAFVDGGPSVRGLLVERVRHGTDHRALVAELIAALERRSASTELTLPELLEPLSDREQAVLRYLPTMMSNAEIASELFLSVNTVKTHLKAIYRKLGATRRRDAVERARRVELL